MEPCFPRGTGLTEESCLPRGTGLTDETCLPRGTGLTDEPCLPRGTGLTDEFRTDSTTSSLIRQLYQILISLQNCMFSFYSLWHKYFL